MDARRLAAYGTTNLQGAQRARMRSWRERSYQQRSSRAVMERRVARLEGRVGQLMAEIAELRAERRQSPVRRRPRGETAS